MPALWSKQAGVGLGEGGLDVKVRLAYTDRRHHAYVG